MKLSQRIILKYYQARFKITERIFFQSTSNAAFELFCTPYTKRRTYIEPEEFANAQKLSFVFEDHTINGFCWRPLKPNGHKILICHGFNSFSYKFKKYIQPLLNLGFEVLAFDAPAHGLSTGKTINALLYANVILKITALYGPFFGIIAHSFGCIAVSLAIEKIEGELCKCLVFIAPATETTRSLNDFCKVLKISTRLKEELKRMIEKIEGYPAEWYSVSRVIQQVTVPTLWLHDKQDTITPYEDMEHLTKLSLPHVTFIITEGLGHSLYNNNEMAEVILAWLDKNLVKYPKLSVK